MVTYETRVVNIYPNGEDEFELDGDEFVLTTDWRGQNRVVAVIATEKDRDRCAYVKDNGERCGRKAEEGSDYCWQHS